MTSRRPGAGLGGLVLAALAAGPVAPGLGADPARTSFLYDSDVAVSALVRPADGQTPLSPADGAYRQEPSGGHLFLGDGDRSRRVAKVSARELRGLGARGMAARLRAAVDRGCGAFGCASRLVAVDEIGAAFSDGRVRIRYRTRIVRGHSIRVVAWNDVVVTRRGYRIVRRTPPLPPVRADGAGARLSRAMRLLSRIPFPGGGSYADRVHLYIAPALVTSVGLGRGAHRTLGRDGLPHRAGWRGVMPALARAGGVWLEMYHGETTGATRSYRAAIWRAAPRSFVRYLTRFGGDEGRVHFLIAGNDAAPDGVGPSCATPMACQWALADLPGVNRRILRNGPGAYALGGHASEWLAQYNVRVRGTPVG